MPRLKCVVIGSSNKDLTSNIAKKLFTKKARKSKIANKRKLDEHLGDN